MEIKKSYIIIIVILLAYVGIVVYLNRKKIFDKTKEYIVFSDTQILEYDKGKIQYIKDFNKIKHLKFKIYDYTEYKGEYEISFIDERYRVFDENNTPIKFRNDFLALYTNNDEIKLNTNPQEILEENDNNIIKKVLEKEKISFPSVNLQGNKRKINLKNFEDAYLYNIAYNGSANSSDDLFSILFVSNGKESIVIEKSNVTKDKYIDLKTYYVNAIIDFENDGNDEIIINTLSYSQSGGTGKNILKYENKKYESLDI